MHQNWPNSAVILTPLRVMALGMSHTVPQPSANQPSPDPTQGAQTQAAAERPSSSIWGSPPKVWAKWGWRSLFLCVACVVAWQSLQPASSEQGLLHLDKALHFIAYGGLMCLAFLSDLKAKGLYLALGITLFGIIIEILQGTMSLGRTLSLADVLANILGIAFVYFLWRISQRRRS